MSNDNGNGGNNGRVDMADKCGRCLYCHGRLYTADGRLCPACNGTGRQTEEQREWVARAGLPAKEQANAD
jgi:DnaJ-class molecular chaperone